MAARRLWASWYHSGSMPENRGGGTASSLLSVFSGTASLTGQPAPGPRSSGPYWAR